MNLNYEFVPCKHDDKKGWRKTQLLMPNKESIKVHEALYEYFYTVFIFMQGRLSIDIKFRSSPPEVFL